MYTIIYYSNISVLLGGSSHLQLLFIPQHLIEEEFVLTLVLLLDADHQEIDYNGDMNHHDYIDKNPQPVVEGRRQEFIVFQKIHFGRIYKFL